MGIYDGIGDDNYKGTHVLALILNKWNGLNERDQFDCSTA
jgi:hypothetical protein